MIKELDSRGYIKGTNIQHKAKVVVLKRFSTKGRIVEPGDIIDDFTGDALVSCLALKKIRMFNPEIEMDVNGKCVPKMELSEGVVTKKLGPKKKKKSE